MSQYMPRRIVEREQLAQLKRRTEGLKSGFYVKYPDKEKGPYIIRAALAAQLATIDTKIDELKQEVENEQN